MSQGVRIAIAQQNFLVGDIQGNAKKIIDVARRSKDELNADLVVFPELTLTGYPPEDLLLRPGFLQRVFEALEQVATETKDIPVLLGHPWKQDDALYNAASLLRKGKRELTYLKQCLPNYGVFDEKRYFSAGSSPVVFDIAGLKCGVTICEDIWEQTPIAHAVEAGAEIILNINASPFHIDKAAEREQQIGARIKEHGLPIIYANLVGGQDELVFDGQSCVVDNKGQLTHRLPAFEESLAIVEVKPGELASVVPGKTEPLMSDTESVYKAIVLGVRDYVKKNGFTGVVIGLSGGIDSALTLVMAVDALGADQVETIMMPSRFTSDMSKEDAEDQAHKLGVGYDVVSIEALFNSFLSALAPMLGEGDYGITAQNIQARIRGALLMAVSNKSGKMVLTTGNKSEMAVGYATLYGDMAGGFAAIKDVPKTLVYRLAEYRNGISSAIPTRVLQRAPSAELAEAQKDSDTLPPYDVLDAILEHYVEQDLCIEDIVERGFDSDVVSLIASMVDRNEYKRRQAAPGVRITKRAFGRDRRYPITSGYGRR